MQNRSKLPSAFSVSEKRAQKAGNGLAYAKYVQANEDNMESEDHQLRPTHNEGPFQR